MKQNNKSGYSIIVSVMIIGFLMVVTAGVLNLVLLELNDTKGGSNYMKAYSAAEGAGELALLKIKENGYAYVDSITGSLNNRSILLADDPLNTSSFNKVKDSLISYDFDYKVNEFEGDLATAGYDIIPLFYIDDSGEHKVEDIKLIVDEGLEGKLAWNIIGKTNGIAGVGELDSNKDGKGRDSTGEYFTKKISEFLTSSETNYLVLFNIDPLNNIKYTLKSKDTDEYFTKPRTDIITSAQIGKYRQNLKISLDNTEFLNILRYSIYSN